MSRSLKPAPRAGALTSNQIGKIGETLVASQLMLASGGRLSPFLPLADDDGVDLVLLDKVTAAALTIQVKTRTAVDDKKAETVEFDVRLATFANRANAYTLAILLDEAGQGIRSAWLVPPTPASLRVGAKRYTKQREPLLWTTGTTGKISPGVTQDGPIFLRLLDYFCSAIDTTRGRPMPFFQAVGIRG